jgi:hypothetical protein
VKDRQSGALFQPLKGQVIRPKTRSGLFSGNRPRSQGGTAPIVTALTKAKCARVHVDRKLVANRN